MKPDKISIEPTIKGNRGVAWQCDLSEGHRQLGVDPAQDGTIAHWVVEAPFAHPIWHSYSIVLLHLRERPIPLETLLWLPNATHEIWVYALDPEKPRERLIKTGIVKDEWLTPCNFASQMVYPDDEAAKLAVYEVVMAICDGRLSPDTDYSSSWKLIFGDCMFKDRKNPQPAIKVMR